MPNSDKKISLNLTQWLLSYQTEIPKTKSNEKIIVEKPIFLWLIRHGESLGNIARREAEKNSHKTIQAPSREPDVELSDFGRKQSAQLGKWFKAQTVKPTVIFSSPYTRARETTQILLEHSDLQINVKFDERLRERELGVFDCLTKLGAKEKYPDLYDLRERWGKFYFRPPGGENWADVIVRLRSFIDTELSKLTGENILIVTHEVVIRCFRYIFEDLNEHEIMEIDKTSDVQNGAITFYEFDGKRNKVTLKLDNYLLL